MLDFGGMTSESEYQSARRCCESPEVDLMSGLSRFDGIAEKLKHMALIALLSCIRGSDCYLLLQCSQAHQGEARRKVGMVVTPGFEIEVHKTCLTQRV